MPTAVGSYGPYPVTILDQSDGDDFNLRTINLSGTGVNPPASQATSVQPLTVGSSLAKH
jgi:hypothetical protein